MSTFQGDSAEGRKDETLGEQIEAANDRAYVNRLQMYFERTGGLELDKVRTDDVLVVGIATADIYSVRPKSPNDKPARLQRQRNLFLTPEDPSNGVYKVAIDSLEFWHEELSYEDQLISLGTATEHDKNPYREGMFSFRPNYIEVGGPVIIDPNATNFADFSPERDDFDYQLGEYTGFRLFTNLVLGNVVRTPLGNPFELPPAE